MKANPVSPVLSEVRQSAEAHRSDSTQVRTERRLSGAIMFGVPFLLVVVTFLFWYQTWFGRRLSGPEMRQYLTDASVPHKTQHALTQVVTEIVQHDPRVKEVYPEITALAGNKEAGIRSMAAWAMGQDTNSPEFHQALLKLVADPEPVVRWNAALGLARFGDASGELELIAMLHPFELRAPSAGKLSVQVNRTDVVKSGQVLARIKSQTGGENEIRSPLAGTVKQLTAVDSALIDVGDEIAIIDPDDQQVQEGLVGLNLVGKSDALAEVDALMRPGNGVSDRVRAQAELTAKAIRARN